METNKKYRLKDIQERIDRDKSTLIRWEKEGLIQKAKRDSRGWRYYSREEVMSIVNKVMSTDYFRNLASRTNA
ncbi:MAG: helix-turn-helix domain-containing protein [Planctomycetes bacterium]|jgi:predicted site-specific integrase-resolvase|nr:helix-turn-helix domain-containing protein [Planctomycetota bacterium]